MPTDQFSPEQPGQPGERRPVRDVADGYVLALADLDPILATSLGLHPGEHRLPDFSPDGQAAADALAREGIQVTVIANTNPQTSSWPARVPRRCLSVRPWRYSVQSARTVRAIRGDGCTL